MAKLFSMQPEVVETFEEIQEVNIKIAQRALSNLRFGGRIGTRYDGSNKIEILDGMQAPY